VTTIGHGKNTLRGWLRSRSLGPFHTSPIDPSCHLLAASRPLAPFGKAVHIDPDASAVGDDACTMRAYFSTSSVSRPSAGCDCRPLECHKRSSAYTPEGQTRRRSVQSTTTTD
jgi:hypothetical protein